jgi:hypothetical protein
VCGEHRVHPTLEDLGHGGAEEHGGVNAESP